MEAIINIGLSIDSPDADNSFAARAERANSAICQLGRRFPVQTRRLTSNYTDPRGLAREEDTLVVKVVDLPQAYTDFLAALLFDVAVALGQECVAVWLPYFHVGALIGPKAGEWTFDLDYFKQFDVLPARPSAPAITLAA